MREIPPPNWVLRTAIGPAILAGQLAVRSTGAQHYGLRKGDRAMSESRGAAHVEHPREGFVRHYIFSRDHKMIGRQFLFAGLFMLIIGGLLAMTVRWQLGFPGQPLPLTTSFISDDFWDNLNWLREVRAGIITGR